MNATCPTCGKPVDPLRARSVGVRDGKVVGYCSAACAQAAETRPVRVPAATAPSAAATAAPTAIATYESGPVIEVIHEPVSGVVSSAADPRLAKGATDGAAKPGKKSDKRAAKAAGKKSTVESAPLVTPPAETVPITKAANAAAPAGAAMAAVVKASEATAPAKGKRSRRDSTDAKAAWDWLDDEPADVGPAEGIATTVKSKRGTLLLVLVLVLAGGGLVTYFLATRQEAAAPASGSLDPIAPPVRTDERHAGTADSAAPAPAPPTTDAALAQATGVLRQHLESGTPRVRRAAATALARSADAPAVAALRGMLDAAGRGAITKDEQRSADQLETLAMAAALARAGDKRGTETLTRSLQSKFSREVRVEAGRLLAQLGDRRAIPVLVQMLGLSQFKLGAAEQLAHLKDPRGIAVLDAVRADSAARPDARARAAIALAYAGRRDLVPELVTLLADGGFGKDAAVALAALGDEAARPRLVELLAFPALRVEAAAALRRLTPAQDLAVHVPGLVQALQSENDMDQIGAAESILLLVGPAARTPAG